MVTGDDIVTTVVTSKRGRPKWGSKYLLRSGCSGTRSGRGQSRSNHGVDFACLAPQRARWGSGLGSDRRSCPLHDALIEVLSKEQTIAAMAFASDDGPTWPAGWDRHSRPARVTSRCSRSNKD